MVVVLVVRIARCHEGLQPGPRRAVFAAVDVTAGAVILPYATRVLEPMMPVNTNEAFQAGLREYPDEDPRLWQKHKNEWASVQ